MIQLHCAWKFRKRPAPRKSDLRRFAAAAAAAAGLPDTPEWNLNLLFVDDFRMAADNEELLGHHGTTDVITFSYFSPDYPIWEKDETMIELIVNPDAAIREGVKRAGGYPQEVALYIVHGLLHSAGEDDLDPVSRRRMRKREKECMAILTEKFDLAALFPDTARA